VGFSLQMTIRSYPAVTILISLFSSFFSLYSWALSFRSQHSPSLFVYRKFVSTPSRSRSRFQPPSLRLALLAPRPWDTQFHLSDITPISTYLPDRPSRVCVIPFLIFFCFYLIDAAGKRLAALSLWLIYIDAAYARLIVAVVRMLEVCTTRM